MYPATPRPPSVSIVIATYNRVAFVRRTVLSALNQTCPDLEVIVSDDGSTDGTVEVLRSFSDPRMRIHCHPRNTGVWTNWATALRMARGRYVVFLGDDDLLAPDFAMRLTGFMDEHPEVAVTFSDLNLIDLTGSRLQLISPPFPADSFQSRGPVLSALLQGMVFFGSAMFRRSQCTEIWERCASDEMVADWGLVLRLAQQPGFLAAALHGVEYSKTVHPGQLGITQGGEVLRLLADLCLKLSRDAFDPEFRGTLLDNSSFHRIGYSRALAREGNLRGARANLRQAVAVRPGSSVAWSQLLQSYLCPWRLANPQSAPRESR